MRGGSGLARLAGLHRRFTAVALRAGPVVPVDEERRRDLDGWLAAASAGHHEVTIRPVSTVEHPVTALLRESREAQPFVVGSRGRGGFRGLVLGSVGMDLLRSPPCPVAIVRRWRHQPEEA